MLRIHPKCSFDLSGLQPDFIVRVVERSFPTYRFLLVSQSDFFKKLLTGEFKERDLKEYNFTSGDPNLFSLIIKTIQGESFEITDLQTALAYLIYVNYLQVKQVGFNQLLQDLTVAPEQFLTFIEALDKIYPEGFSQEVIDIIASKIRLATPLSVISPKLQQAIHQSDYYPFLGKYTNFTDKALQIVEKKKGGPLKYYVDLETYLIYPGHSPEEALMRSRRHSYQDQLKRFDRTTSLEDFREKADMISQFLSNEDEIPEDIEDVEKMLDNVISSPEGISETSIING